jgi:predicted RND superfamily exporter protein
MSMALVDRLVQRASSRPRLTVALAALAGVALWGAASRIQLRSDLRELLPHDSATYQLYARQAARVEQGATLIVVATSPQREANRRFIAALARSIAGHPAIAFVESEDRAVHAFFEAHRWLYLPLADLERIDDEVRRTIAVRSGVIEDLGDGAGSLADRLAPWRERAASALRRLTPTTDGTFTSPDGRAAGLRIVSTLPGAGDRGGQALLDEVRARADGLRRDPSFAGITVGFGGDIPNALEEKRSVAADAIGATALATALVLAAVVLFFRSAWALVVIALPVALGVGGAYAFAAAAFGYVNTSGAFLGAIILGNGINYPIVLLARYQDFRARGMPAIQARQQAVRSAFRAELVGAAVAAIAYGSLTVTDFRGFRQFGAIGFVGMLLVWTAVIPVVPALIAWRDPPARTRSLGMGRLARWVRRHPGPVVAAAALSAVALAGPIARWLGDPWQYNFAELGSRHAQTSGAGRWSVRADALFGGKSRLTGALMVADTPAQAPLVARELLARDRRQPGAPLIDTVVTLEDLLPGAPAEQAQKLALLARLDRRLTPRVLEALAPEERRLVEEVRPPSGLAPIAAGDLPLAIRRLFTEKDGTLGAVLYVRFRPEVSLSDGHNLLRIAAVTNRVTLPDGAVVDTASRAGVFSEIFRSLERDGPFATAVSFLAVVLVVLVATRQARGSAVVLGSLVLGVIWMVGLAALRGERLNFLNFVALPITFGIGCEYPFNVYDRTRLLGGQIEAALERTGGAVALCSYTTVIGYGSLLAADNQALQSFGRLAITGELACVVAALVVLPALLVVLPSRHRAFSAAEARS